MCGAYSFRTREDALRDLYPWLELDERLQESFNIRPTHPAPIVPNQPIELPDEGGESIPVPNWPRRKPVRVARFGIPAPWNEKQMLINTRDDSLLGPKPFWKSMMNNRCLVLADGFYEWQVQQDGKTKQPFYFQIDGGRPFAFAGLFRIQQTDQGNQLFMSILTTKATDFVAEIHNTKKRMPVILPAGSEQDWIDPEPMDLDQIKVFLKQYPASKMNAYTVSKKVSNPTNDGADLIVPIENQKKFF